MGLKDFRFSYDTYQDVRHNLFLYSTPFLIGAGFFAYWMIMPQVVRDFVDTSLSNLPAPAWIKSISGVIGFGFIAFLLTELLQVHDQWYDKFIIRWRYFYATDFILPRLIHPFASRISPRFHEVAAQNVATFQERLYYPFVGDRDGKIGKNRIVRFYEVVTVYWLTQINEIVLLLLFSFVVVFRWVGPADLAFRTTLLNSAIIVVGVTVLNRIWCYFSLQKVRRATADEIDAILSDHKDELERRVITLCRDYGIPINDPSSKIVTP